MSGSALYKHRRLPNAPALVQVAANEAGSALGGSLSAFPNPDASLIADPLAVWCLPFDGMDGGGSGELSGGDGFVVSDQLYRLIRANRVTP